MMGINLRIIENTISGNTIASGSTGIRLHNCSESVVSMNNISNNYYGIADNTSYHNIFNGNIIENCTLGISSSGTGGGWSGSNHFFDNLIESGSVGIQMTQTSDNYITMNEIKYMSNSGIYNGFQSENNIISNNVLQWNGDSNVARGKPVIQSSNQFGRDGSEAVDGSRDGNFNHGSVSCTDNMPYPFWQVDLEFIYSVDRIAIYNRTDCCPERLRDFVIEKSVDGKNFSPVVHHSGNAGEVLELDLNGQKARYLRVSMNRYEFLSIAEFEVYGEKIE
jgi:parallel beta-helix repeat protein